MNNSIDFIIYFVIFETTLCINRCYLIDNAKTRLICFIVTTSSIITSIGVNIYDFLYENLTILEICFQILVFVEIFNLLMSAKRNRKSFKALQRYNEKCGYNDDYSNEMKREGLVATAVGVISMIINITGTKMLGLKNSNVVLTTIGSGARDAEFSFYTLLIKAINKRISELKETDPYYGSKVYRHTIMTSSQINLEFRNSVSIMIGATMSTTVIYAVAIIMNDAKMFTELLVYIAWLELKSLYSLWSACAAAADSENICKNLSFKVARKLLFDTTINGNDSPQRGVMKRWYVSLTTCRPHYDTFTDHPLNLSVPLKLLHVSATYLLIIIQFYMANQ